MCYFKYFTFYGILATLLLLQYVSCDLTNCLDQISKTKLKLPVDIVNDNGALELWFRYNEKYDLYLTYNTGSIYHAETQINEKITPRTGADKANCSNYLPSVPHWYNCPWIVSEDDHQVNITLESFLDKIVYSIDQSTEEVAKYVSALYSPSGPSGKTSKDTQIDCVNEATKYSIPLPIEVVRKVNHLEITVKYEGKYDFYNTIALGTICSAQYQLEEKPDVTLEDYAHCTKCDSAAELYAYCPFKISEDENDVKITVKAFFYNNIYTINKISKEVHYEKSLEGIDPKKSFEENINKCINRLSTTNFPLPVKIIRNADFLEIWVKYNNKYDIFETDVSGSICKRNFQTSRDPSDGLVPRHPADCFSRGLDIPYYFLCTYDIVEDDDYVYFTIHSLDKYLYAFKKSSDEVEYRTFSTIQDSTHQSSVTYLRSVVMNTSRLF